MTHPTQLPGRLLIVVALVLAGLPALHAQQTPPPAVPAPTVIPRTAPAGFTRLPDRPIVKEETVRLPMRRLIGLEEPIVLRRASSIYTVFLPVSPRVQLKSTFFHLEFTNSIALLGERSVLRVVVNDVIVAQYYLDRNHPFNSADIPIPADLLKGGFNRVQIVAAQHYTYKCEDPDAPELFTEINPDASYFSAVTEWREVPQRLSYLRWWIDERLWNPYQFNVCLSSNTDPELQLAWGGIVTQGVALALNYQPFRVSTANALRPGMDNIVIGKMSDLSAYLTSTEIGSINGTFIAIKSMPGDPAHCVIIISGRDDQEVSQTALAFGLVNFPLPDSQYATIPQMSLPKETSYIRNAPIQDPGIYSFRQFGYNTKTISGWYTGNYQVQIYMPGDISKDDPSNAEVRLHFTYGASFRKDSVLNIMVNGQFQKAIRLADPDGSMHSDHRLYLPMVAFQPGRNTIDLIPRMVPLYTNRCELIQEENLHITLYDDSQFVFPRMLHKARLPSLGLFSQTAYPFSAPPDGSETALFVAGRDPETVCAAWTILGKMAQVSGALLHRMEVSFRPVRSKKSLLVVGPRDQIPDEIVARAPVSPLQVGKMRYLVSISPKPERLAASPIEEFIERIRGEPSERSEPEPPATANLSLTADMVQDSVAIQFESPFNQGYPVTLITANDPSLLLSGVNALQDRSVWDNLAGDLAVWNSSPDSLAVCKVGPDFIYKVTSVVSRMNNKLQGQPLLFAIFIVALIIGIALAVRFVLKRRENKPSGLE